MAMLVAVGVLFADHILFFYGILPLKAKYLTLILAAFLVVGDLLAKASFQIALFVGGAIAALFFLFRINQLIGMVLLRRAKRKFKVINGKKDERWVN